MTHTIRTGQSNIHHLHAGETKSPHCSVHSARHLSILSLMCKTRMILGSFCSYIRVEGRRSRSRVVTAVLMAPAITGVNIPTSENQWQASSSGFRQRVLYLSCTLGMGLLPKVYPPPCKTPTAQPRSMVLVGFRCHQVTSEDLPP